MGWQYLYYQNVWSLRLLVCQSLPSNENHCNVCSNKGSGVHGCRAVIIICMLFFGKNPGNAEWSHCICPLCSTKRTNRNQRKESCDSLLNKQGNERRIWYNALNWRSRVFFCPNSCSWQWQWSKRCTSYISIVTGVTVDNLLHFRTRKGILKQLQLGLNYLWVLSELSVDSRIWESVVVTHTPHWSPPKRFPLNVTGTALVTAGGYSEGGEAVCLLRAKNTQFWFLAKICFYSFHTYPLTLMKNLCVGEDDHFPILRAFKLTNTNLCHWVALISSKDCSLCFAELHKPCQGAGWALLFESGFPPETGMSLLISPMQATWLLWSCHRNWKSSHSQLIPEGAKEPALDWVSRSSGSSRKELSAAHSPLQNIQGLSVHHNFSAYFCKLQNSMDFTSVI